LLNEDLMNTKEEDASENDEDIEEEREI